jgi:sugar lactone lactonase YvrE
MQWLRSLSRRAAGLRRPRPARPRTRLALETLEGRWVPSTVTELPLLPTPNAAPAGITTAPNGSVWFTEKGANKVARLSTAGVLTEYAVPTAASSPEKITASPDGWVWFTERSGRKIGRISQAGGPIAEFALTGVGEFPTAITTRSDGTVWFASNQQPSVARLGKISPTGVITELPTAASRTYITGIASGPDGNLWVTEVSSYWGDGVAKVNTAGWGTFTNYKLPNHAAGPQSIVSGPDNNLWFTESNGNAIGRITTGGLLTEFALAACSGPQQITRGPDGALWFTEQSGNRIGRMTTAGALTEYAVPTLASQPVGITTGADGNLYFTESAGNRIGKVVV